MSIICSYLHFIVEKSRLTKFCLAETCCWSMANLDTHAGTWPPVFLPRSTPLSSIIPAATCTWFHHTKLLWHQENEDKGRTLWHSGDQSQMWTIKIKMFIFHVLCCHLAGSSIKFPESETKYWDLSHLQSTTVFPNWAVH